MIVVLTGGTGGAKLVEGLAAISDPSELTIVCNTGDDCVFHGLHISPDLDTITYTLGGLIDTAKGWGVKGDSFAAQEQLRRLGNDVWFNLGDKDLATHITRTCLLNAGLKLSAITDRIRRALGVKATILPMSDDRIETRVQTPRGEISFQEYFVKERWTPEVSAVRFAGAEKSRPAPGVLDAIRDADAVIFCPSNPVTSIGPILAVTGVRAALAETKAAVVGVSPIIGKAAVSGPAHRLMSTCGWDPSPVGVAQAYADFLDILFIEQSDYAVVGQIEELGVKTVCASIRMTSAEDKERLASQVLAFVGK
jgi:LPPG:FO 2-phospho-L-lactate transferase